MCIDVFFILFLFQVAVNYIKELVILQYGYVFVNVIKMLYANRQRHVIMVVVTHNRLLC